MPRHRSARAALKLEQAAREAARAKTAATRTLGDSPRFQDIPKFTRTAGYSVDVVWSHLEQFLEEEIKTNQLDLDPDFQRGHVWTPEQQSRYVEYILRGGKSSRDIQTNCPGWQAGRVGNYVLVDGKQRVQAARAFLQNQVTVFGGYRFRDFTDTLNLLGPGFRWHVNDLESRAEVLQWYLDLNTGGVIHTSEEIQRVRVLLAEELGK